ncbi:phosphodiester glycosidase family protein [Candidatus Poribacteria bacterium]|nr:phosphodiester glycosidase family protein [Candidatus Poribacteria bacterium]
MPITPHISRLTFYTIHFIKRHRRIFITLGCLLIFFAGTWAGRSVRVKRITTLLRSHMSLSRYDVTVQIAPGIKHRQIKRGVLMNILEISPDAAIVRPYRALDMGIGTESLVSLARRHKALAAINGGYFEMASTFRGESVGALKINGEWMSEPEQGRAAIALSTVDNQMLAMIDRIELRVELVLPSGKTLTISGINRGRIADELILYRPIFHPVTLTDPDGLELIVRNNHIVEIRDRQGSSRIPDDGYVLSANGKKRDWLLVHVSVGDKICIREIVFPDQIEHQGYWEAAEHIISGGPLLLRDGVSMTSDEQDGEGFDRSFYGWWHPRTAVGIKPDKSLIFVTISDANPKVRRGVKLSRLAELLAEWGARDALNLDGGGSTMMIIDGEIVSTRLLQPRKEKTARGNRRIRPTPPNSGRPIADAFLVFPRKK